MPFFGEIAKPVIKKIFGRGKRRYRQREKKYCYDDVLLLRVMLPNGQSFVARYERVSRKNIPRNITVKKVWKIGPRQRRTQKGGSIVRNIVKLDAKLGAIGFAKGLFRKRVSAGTKTLSSDLGQNFLFLMINSTVC